jgi:glucuronokinase
MSCKDFVRISVPARAGILGNPSDGFNGKTIAAPVRNFYAEVILFEWDRIEILPGPTDNIKFENLNHLIEDIHINGYYGGFRLIKAAIHQFWDYCQRQNFNLPDKKFSLRYTSNIPRQVGLAGSSAIITATMKALCTFYGLEIRKEVLANLVLWSETKELGISAGLQDRVVQVYNEPVFMDFNLKFIEENGYGIYKSISSKLFPPMYLAYQTTLTHIPTAHNDVRKRWEAGDLKVIDTMGAIAQNANVGYQALINNDLDHFKKCINNNFDLRASIYPIAPKNEKLIKMARSIGATAKFPGSGGAIIGTYDNDEMFESLTQKLGLFGCNVVKIKFE